MMLDPLTTTIGMHFTPFVHQFDGDPLHYPAVKIISNLFPEETRVSMIGWPTESAGLEFAQELAKQLSDFYHRTLTADLERMKAHLDLVASGQYTPPRINFTGEQP